MDTYVLGVKTWAVANLLTLLLSYITDTEFHKFVELSAPTIVMFDKICC